MIGGGGEGEQEDFGDKRSIRIRPICGGMDSLRLKLYPSPCQYNPITSEINPLNAPCQTPNNPALRFNKAISIQS